MPDYQQMYHILFNSITDAILVLQEAQKETEKIFTEEEEDVLPFPLPDLKKIE